ncbi:trypco2 family protein [Streptomyces microflavus]|uniref:trypco2 family protein n=1 Tax=Streptomyces griseus group TaxID=629295 RepID=UPI0033F646C9
MTNPLEGVALADAVRAIRSDLIAATTEGDGSPLRFELGDIQMEFAVELRRDSRAKAGVKAWLATASGELGSSSARTQKINFTLRPKNSTTGGSWDIANSDEGEASLFGTEEG